MRISSNISAVIQQTRKLIEHIPVAAQAALRPEVWHEEARGVAERVLRALASPEESALVPRFMASLEASGLTGGGLKLTMRSPESGSDLIEQARSARGVTSGKELGRGLFDLPVRQFEELMEEWVGTPESEGGKRRDARDMGKTDEDIAHLISYIMLTPNPGKKAEKARAGLEPHIAAWLSKRLGGGLDPATADLWLRSVLAGWREMVKLLYPGKVWTAMREV